MEKEQRVLGPQDETVAERFTELVRSRYELRLGRELTRVGGHLDALRLTLDDGRRQRTSAEGVFALGDICSRAALKHVANREAEVVAHNLRHPDDLVTCDHERVPAAVFTQPQIASVGLTEQGCRDRGPDYTVSTAGPADTAYGWAMEDTTGFCRVLADPDSGRLLGAHLMGAQVPTLMQPLVLAVALCIDAATPAGSPYRIHRAPTEVVENALHDLDLDLER
ncbi:NAD(P)/FAD-dependent oxidoreductase [Streptomyces erythrochromogenes]|uniref:hypothetical protein n=1 Tax=Streptomyces erythrochromogenes TaxID=285574 RepID=UPI003812F1A6